MVENGCFLFSLLSVTLWHVSAFIFYYRDSNLSMNCLFAPSSGHLQAKQTFHINTYLSHFSDCNDFVIVKWKNFNFDWFYFYQHFPFELFMWNVKCCDASIKCAIHFMDVYVLKINKILQIDSIDKYYSGLTDFDGSKYRCLMNRCVQTQKKEITNEMPLRYWTKKPVNRTKFFGFEKWLQILRN